MFVINLRLSGIYVVARCRVAFLCEYVNNVEFLSECLNLRKADKYSCLLGYRSGDALFVLYRLLQGLLDLIRKNYPLYFFCELTFDIESFMLRFLTKKLTYLDILILNLRC